MPKAPKHIAVIMDGNGRWAESRGLKRAEGHRAGTETVERLLDHLIKVKVPFVSLYAFSTENWRRPRTEITAIFKLLDEFIIAKLPKMIKQGVRIVTSGDISRLPKRSRELLQDAVKKTARGRRLTANFCLNYGSRAEILRAAELALAASKNGKLTEKQLARALWQPSIPDVDLLVRTAGELRLSNFMLWQAAYAELYFTEKNWPDFAENDIDAAIAEFGRRKRKFGGL
ncbi:MAG TPA: polyprenyl diphosphate synthase [Turneriella sp.]|nr:polyprenyl diphosphate synthase [Turneriella sp.]HMY11016.1 polyprenyl diphosphate synthase [Turneriella sp.]HNA78517.1 polyprenyl diphosphate synthase [Turneriella sp.]HNL53207.1 polyprenyl diphosphate synthase [Turneriella sp.]